MCGEKYFFGAVWFDVLRITPACAGKRDARKSMQFAAEDHPRVCGEKRRNNGGPDTGIGSPPRVRGKVLFWCSLVRCAEDHPRVCGEKFCRRSHLPGFWGSPPRVRGKACRSVAGCALRRITPACAGKSHRELFCLYRGPDHPRVCGEKGSSQDGHERQPGSPPRVRGKA